MTIQNRLAEVFPAVERGLQAEIARLVGKAKPSVSAWFNQPDKVQNIERRDAEIIIAHYKLPHSPSWLAEGTLPKMANDVRSAPAITDAEPEFAGEVELRLVPVVGTAKMGDDGYYGEISSVPGAGDGHIEIATRDANAYGLRVKGQSMFPAIRDGWYVLIEPNGTPKEGEYVLVKLNDGRKMVKEFLYRRIGSIELMSVNGDERITIEAADLQDMQAVGAVVSPSKWKPD